MKNFLTIIFLLTLLQAKAQVPHWDWVRTATGTGSVTDEEVYIISTDPSENIFVVGFYLVPPYQLSIALSKS